ncbi:hypothetical protein BW14_04575 [Bifidobacterium sp. UTBIF-68]|nr:hypothetical protein BW14_04575 [Bifidobacterium sp. UTBIF-68]
MQCRVLLLMFHGMFHTLNSMFHIVFHILLRMMGLLSGSRRDRQTRAKRLFRTRTWPPTR